MNDVIIVGAGIIGLSIAFELQYRGKKCVIIDPRKPGSEASWAAAGMLAPQIETKAPSPAWVLGRYSRNLYSSWIEKLRTYSDIDPNLQTEGAALFIAPGENTQTAIDDYRWQKDEGESVDCVRAHEILPDSKVQDALFFNNEAQVEPRLLCQLLVEACLSIGVEFQVGESVSDLVRMNNKVCGVKTAQKTYLAEDVIICAGSWTQLIGGIPLQEQRVYPVRGQMMSVTTNNRERLPLLTNHRVYIVPRLNGWAVIGSTEENVGFTRGTTAEDLNKLFTEAKSIWPSLANSKILDTWCGFRPASSDKLPLIGPCREPGLFLATGHFRNGILQAPATAQIICNYMYNEPCAIDPHPYAASRAIVDDSTEMRTD
ncbi:MAG: glycine oxidase ThiO [Myxococcota bacterium]|nr:glycine oxidase ThiO [Myxococcota bacterium]